MQLRNNIALRATSGLIAIIVCCIAWRNVRIERSQASALKERFTSQHILDKTTALVPVLNSLASASAYSAEYYTIPRRHSVQKHVWYVDYADGNDLGLGHCVWDADTGQLTEVLCLRRTKAPVDSAFTSTVAAVTAKIWLNHLGLQSKLRASHLIAAPLHEGHRWTASFQLENRIASVMMDEDGALVAIYRW